MILQMNNLLGKSPLTTIIGKIGKLGLHWTTCTCIKVSIVYYSERVEFSKIRKADVLYIYAND